MDYKEFRDMVLKEMQERNPEMNFRITDVEKVQGESYTGLAFGREGSNISAAMDLTPFYEAYQENTDLDAIMEDIQVNVDHAVEAVPQIDTGMLADYEQMKSSLVMQVLPVEGNEDRLAGVPHEVMGDIATVYRFEVDGIGDNEGSILVTNNMLSVYGITEEQLRQDALEQAPINRPASLRSLSEVISEMTGGVMSPREENPVYVATVDEGFQGAAVINYPGFLDEAAEKMGQDFYLLPSSIHEVLLMPDNAGTCADELNAMISEINETAVDPKDRLSDQAYHYDSTEHLLEPASQWEERMAVREEAMEYGEADTMTVLLVQPGLYPKEVTVGTDLESLQAAVGGDIEVVYPFDEEVGIICNEEGKISGLDLNRALRDDEGKIYDVLAGDFLVAGLTEDNFCSLTPDQMKQFEEAFHQPEAFVRTGRGIIAVPVADEAVKKREEQLSEHTHEPKVKQNSRNEESI